LIPKKVSVIFLFTGQPVVERIFYIFDRLLLHYCSISVLAFSLFPSIYFTRTHLYQTEAAARTQFVHWIHCEVHWFTQLTHCGFCAVFVATLNSYP